MPLVEDYKIAPLPFLQACRFYRHIRDDPGKGLVALPAFRGAQGRGRDHMHAVSVCHQVSIIGQAISSDKFLYQKPSCRI